MADLRRRKQDYEDAEQINDNNECRTMEQPKRRIDNKHKNLHITLNTTDSTDHVNMTKYSFFLPFNFFGQRNMIVIK